MSKYKIFLFSIILGFSILNACTSSPELQVTSISDYVAFDSGNKAMSIVSEDKATPIVLSNNEHSGVIKMASLFQKDIEMVSGISPKLEIGKLPQSDMLIVVGTIGQSHLIDQLVEQGKIDIQDVKGRWENSLIQVVDNPFEGVEKALIIAGSDKRGTIYGMFDISRKMGVSPWYWWADVPVKKHDAIFVKNGRYNLGEPKVKYRGIFLNDEEPALGHWAIENYGGFNHQFYEKVFELSLRLKANYLWPAMWWANFNSDDPMNPKLADELGIVMGTTHHEPMMRSHAEWKPYGGGEWNYATNKGQLDKFWQEGIERMGNYESIVTLAMRGDGDVAMGEGTNISLLENIVEEQRKIIADVTGKPTEETPQLWALYKEVQEYYETGMQVPDDVTLLLCDDNWGNVRHLPKIDAEPRSGGYGMYYHFDFVGGPRSYKWLNTSPLPRVWEQMNLTYQHGVDRIWLVNVGDLKPMELPVSFFLDYAWNPEAIQANDLEQYTINWAAEQFGAEYADEIAWLLRMYPKYNARRKPESLYSDTYSLTNYREFETVVNDYQVLVQKAEAIYDEIADNQKDAFYQLVYQPIQICSNLNELYYYHAKNLLYAEQGRASTNKMANKVKELFKKDAEITEHFHTQLADGKWNHFMAQPHIGYTSWQQPDKNYMPSVKEIKIPEQGKLGVSVEGNELWWPKERSLAKLPSFDSFNKQSFYIELFNTGSNPIDYTISTNSDWLVLSSDKGEVKQEQRIDVSVDWTKVEVGTHTARVKVESTVGETVELEIITRKYNHEEVKPKGFVERNGYVSMEAPHFTNAVNTSEITWQSISDMGKTLGAVTALPVSKRVEIPAEGTPVLEYAFTLLEKPENGEVEIQTYLSPTLNYFGGEGLRFAISIDDETPQIINMHEGTEVPDWKYPDWWNNAVLNSIIVKKSTHKVSESGNYVLKYWLVDPAIVLQKLVINNGGVKPSYLGAPESIIK